MINDVIFTHLAEYNNFISTETFATWFNDYYVERRRISPLQARSIRASLENYSSIFQNLEHSIKNSLCQVYPNPVVSEWLGAYIKPITRDLAEKLRKTYSVIGWSDKSLDNQKQSKLTHKWYEMLFLKIKNSKLLW